MNELKYLAFLLLLGCFLTVCGLSIQTGIRGFTAKTNPHMPTDFG
jgi:hypothetical protein